MRPNREETFLNIAVELSKRSTCLRRPVGCVFTDAEGFILSTGYNGAPRGLPHCQESGCLMEEGHCIRALHAEVNAMLTAGRHGVSLAGSNVFTTTRPCLRCMTMLAQIGVASITYMDDYATDDADRAYALASLAGIRMVKHKPKRPMMYRVDRARRKRDSHVPRAHIRPHQPWNAFGGLQVWPDEGAHDQEGLVSSRRDADQEGDERPAGDHGAPPDPGGSV